MREPRAPAAPISDELSATHLRLAASVPVWTAPLDEAIPELLSNVGTAMRVSRVGLWLFNEKTDALHLRWLYDQRLGSKATGAVIQRARAPKYFEAMLANRVVAISNVFEDPRTATRRDAYKALGVHAMLDATLRIAGLTAGVLCVEYQGNARQPTREWTRTEADFAVSMADLAAQVITTNRQRDEHAIVVQIGEQLKALTGQELLDCIVPALGKAFGADFVRLGEFQQDGTRMQTLVNVVGGSLAGEARMEVARTAVEDIRKDGSCQCMSGARERYPLDAFIQAERIDAVEGYLVRDANGGPAAALVFYYRGTIPAPDRNARIIALGIARIEGELQRRRAEQRLREQEARFHAIFEATDDLIVLVRRVDRMVVECNPAMLAVAGVPRDQIVGRPVEHFLQAVQPLGQPVESLYLIMGAITQIGTRIPFDSAVHSPSGRAVNLSGSATLILVDGVQYWMSVQRIATALPAESLIQAPSEAG